jgi:DNA-binding XRE family transcriptional regulator
MEVWKDIKGYEGHYQVSNLGRVKSLKNNKELIMTNVKSNLGYLRVKLSKDGKIKGFPVHRLVGLTFLDLINGKNEINHIDGNKKNNCLTNLEWCNRSENMRHADKTGLRVMLKGKRNPKAKLTDEQIRLIRYERKGIQQKDIAKEFNIKQQTISKIINNKLWTHII